MGGVGNIMGIVPIWSYMYLSWEYIIPSILTSFGNGMGKATADILPNPSLMGMPYEDRTSFHPRWADQIEVTWLGNSRLCLSFFTNSLFSFGWFSELMCRYIVSTVSMGLRVASHVWSHVPNFIEIAYTWPSSWQSVTCQVREGERGRKSTELLKSIMRQETLIAALHDYWIHFQTQSGYFD